MTSSCCVCRCRSSSIYYRILTGMVLTTKSHINSSRPGDVYASVNLCIIASDIWLSLVWCQAIACVNQCWHIVPWTSWNLNKKFSFTNMNLKMPYAKWRFCVGLNVSAFFDHYCVLNRSWWSNHFFKTAEEISRDLSVLPISNTSL